MTVAHSYSKSKISFRLNTSHHVVFPNAASSYAQAYNAPCTLSDRKVKAISDYQWEKTSKTTNISGSKLDRLEDSIHAFLNGR